MPDAARNRREVRNRAKLALWLAVPFVALMLLVSPRGDFPLNDDWVYAKMVQALADRGHFGLSPISNAFALTQTLYAAPFVKLFGFSFTLLRLTTIFMAWVTVCFTAFTARELGLSNSSAVLAALVVFVNPLFINLSYTFMTDVPFCAFAAVSTYYFVKALRSPTKSNLLLGTLFSIAAFYDRQIGVLIPVAFVVAGALAGNRWRPRPDGRLIACLLVPWALAFAALPIVAVPPAEALEVQTARGLGGLAWLLALGGTLGTLATYAGLFLLPMAGALVVAWPSFRLTRLRPNAARTTWLYVGTVLLGNIAIAMFPVLPNIVRDFGVGPAPFSFLGTRRNMGIEFAPVQIGYAWCVVAYAATAGFCIVVDAVVRQFGNGGVRLPAARKAQMHFLLACGVLFLAAPFQVIPTNYFDRYVLPAVSPFAVLATLCLGYRPPLQRLAVAACLASMLAAWSVIGLQDYIAWNTARWRAIDIVRAKYRAPDNEINAGFEFNGMYTSEEYLRRTRGEPETFVRKKFWVIGEIYRVSPVDMTQYDEDYEVLETVPYYSWLGFETRQIYVLGQKHAAP